MRLCYSRAAFVRAYISEKLECFLDGHVRAFRYFGGIPPNCAYDNLRTAVTWVGVGKERKLNRRFVKMRCHYVFNSHFCNVASGNEKGLAENLVKRTQSDFLAGVPCFASIEELNAYLEKCCPEDLLRTAPNSTKTRGELFGEEKKALLEIAHGDFEACSRCPAGDVSDALAITNNYVYTKKLTGTAGGRITMPVLRRLSTALRFTATTKRWQHISVAGRSRNIFWSTRITCAPFGNDVT